MELEPELLLQEAQEKVEHFSDLKETLGKLLGERLVTLLQEVDAIEQETMKPLDDCQKLIKHGVNTAEDLVREGEIAILGVKAHIFQHGTVASRPPVQIEELIEKPEGIIVRWCKVDDDFTAQDYRLQFRKCASNHFEDVYVGSETEFIVLHIDPSVDYQFRVCA
ncbi:Cytokine receptor-like factor 3 [Fukomys damarensis]|uniref:Cytokine receptor-like factor 3 n=1 Tax=Fukomys damarensis TaxID=885580 RepID=A0A091DEN8_FUKDA|nr:Cytokine receptor-like factor 3 [Fukomys damarensis]